MGKSTRPWRPATFTAILRGQRDGNPPVSRWEALLEAERSIAALVVRAAARRPRLRRLLALPREAAAPPAATLVEREAAVEALRNTALGRALDRAAGVAERSPATTDVRPSASGGPPSPGPLLDVEVERALALLAAMPFEELQRRGWHFQPNHFYWPLNDVDFLRASHELWHDRGLPRGIDWDLDAQLALAAELDGYRRELADVPREPRPGRVEFVWENNAFGGADAVVYYGLVRQRRPRRVVEVGSGWSSMLLARALVANEAPCAVTLVEPEPNPELFAVLPAGWDVRRSILQQADLALFERLERGDLCVYDGTHCVRTGSDVNWFFFEVLPRLAPGVVVLIHDVLFPEDYYDRWIFDEGLSWNEQYLLQAFLMHNRGYRMLIANHALWTERRAEVDALHGADGTAVVLEKL